MNDMPTGLIRRGGAYSLRRRIPKDLLASYGGRKEIVRALGTSDREEAKRFHARAWVSLDEEFASRRIVPTEKANLPPSIAAYGQWQDYPQEEFEAALADMDRQAQESDQADFEAEQRQEDRDAIRSLLNQPPTGLTQRELAMREVLETFRDELAVERDRSVAPSPSMSSATAPPSELSTPKADGVSFDYLIELWSRERRVTPKTAQAMSSVVSWFQAREGSLFPSQVRTSHVRSFKEKMLSEGVGPANIRTKLSRLKSLLSFASSNDYIETNPAKDITIIVREEDKKTRQPYGRDQLNALFGGPVHARGERPTRGRGEAAFWLPLLSLYSGARLEELAQLTPNDVSEVAYYDADDVEQKDWFINVRASEDGSQRLKNAASARLIPVHSELLNLGFAEFVLQARQALHVLLFPALTRSAHGRLGAKWGEWFSEYRRSTCGIVDPSLNFHSFRHTFARIARDRGLDPGVMRRLMGHSAEDVSDAYGQGYSLHRLASEMRRYHVPGLRLPARPSSLT